MRSLSLRCRLTFVIAIQVGITGCDFMDRRPPEPRKPLEYTTVDVSLRGCATQLPPVHDGANCGALEIGGSIDAREVCDLLESLKKWVDSAPAGSPSIHPNDWAQVRAVCVTHGWWIGSPHDKPISPPRSYLRLEADAPDRSLRFFVQTTRSSRGLEYFVSPRPEP
jgi:hypothetical protein